jgi:hypothetical protein
MATDLRIQAPEALRGVIGVLRQGEPLCLARHGETPLLIIEQPSDRSAERTPVTDWYR